MDKPKKDKKTPDELTSEFKQWKEKISVRLLKLYQEKSAKERAGKDIDEVAKNIDEIESKISQKKARLDRQLAQAYERMYRAGASTDAKEERRERTHHLCNLGGLVEKAGLGELDAASLLGMLLQQADFLAKNPVVLERWKSRGQEALKSEQG